MTDKKSCVKLLEDYDGESSQNLCKKRAHYFNRLTKEYMERNFQ